MSSDVPPGRIDLHSHLLPGIDDGCEDLDDTFESVERLIELGYVGTVCTPHLWPDAYPHNTAGSIIDWTRLLSERLADEGFDYRLWPGGELRLFPEVIRWVQSQGVPTLGDSRCVLMDFWDSEWPSFVDEAIDWLLAQGYKPILAHPERLGVRDGLKDQLKRLKDKGVLLQGNLRCFTRTESRTAQERAPRWLTEGLYDVLALDMHAPDTLEDRLDGLSVVKGLVGPERLAELVDTVPRKLLGLSED